MQLNKKREDKQINIKSALEESLMEEKKDIIKHALDQFPELRKVIGEQRILEIAQEDPRNPLIAFLEKTCVEDKRQKQIQELFEFLKKEPKHVGAIFLLDYYLRPYNTLKHLNRCIGIIASEQRLEVALSHLIDPKSYWQGYSEIEVAAYLKKQFGNISLEPALSNGKSVDMKYVLNDQDYFVEVTAPKSYYKFQEKMGESAKTGKVVTLEDSTPRASEKILTEVEHFKGIKDETKSIIIMNVNGSEFDESEIEDSLLGVSKLAILKDPKTGNFLGTKVTRDPWNSFEADEDLRRIGLVMTYKRDFALNGAVDISKKLFVISFIDSDYKPLEKLFQ